MPNVLTAAEIAAVQQAIRQLEDAKHLCQKGANCGFDFSGHEATATGVQQRLQAILNEFGLKSN